MNKQRTAGPETGPHIVIVDAMNLFHRALHSYTHMYANGVPTGATYGFLQMVLTIMKKYKTGNVVIAWEGKRNWRKLKTAEYKAVRKAKQKKEYNEEDKLVFDTNVEAVKRLLSYTEILQVQNDFFEADDIVFYLVNHFAGRGRVTIVSNDKDYLQLVSDTKDIRVARPEKGEYIDMMEADVEASYGVPARFMGVLLGLMGDSSDSVPGVRGIGKVNAMKIINSITMFRHANIRDELKKILGDTKYKEFINSYELVAMRKPLLRRVQEHASATEIIGGRNRAYKLQEALDKLAIRRFSAVDIVTACKRNRLERLEANVREAFTKKI